MDSESLYWRLPIWMQHAACGMEGWRIQRRRYGRGFCALLAEVEQRTHWSAEELFGYRDRQIRDYVRYCAAFVPYYRDWFALSRIDPRDVRGLEDLRVLPIIRKGDVQAEGHRFVAEGISPRHRVERSERVGPRVPDFGSLRRSMRSSISGRCGGGIVGGTVLSAGRGAGTWAGASWCLGRRMSRRSGGTMLRASN